MQLEITVEDVDGYQVVVPRGEVDIATNGQLKTVINDLVVDGKVNLVVDLSEVDFLDSTGLGALIGGRRKAHAFKGSFAIVCADEQLLKVFRITGLDKVFAIHDNRADAIKGPEFESSPEG